MQETTAHCLCSCICRCDVIAAFIVASPPDAALPGLGYIGDGRELVTLLPLIVVLFKDSDESVEVSTAAAGCADDDVG